jgi:hypothetical protein
VISVIKDLFYVNKVIPLAMKWKEAEDKANEQSVIKQMQGVQEDKMSCEKEVRTQEKENSETGDQKEGEESIKLGLNEQMQEAQEIQESICKDGATAQEDENSENEVKLKIRRELKRT